MQEVKQRTSDYLQVLGTLWTFTHDLLNQEAFPVGDLTINNPTMFRLKDGDGIIYYYGLISRKFLNSGDPFAPLDARSSEGVTTMEYLNDKGTWEEL